MDTLLIEPFTVEYMQRALVQVLLLGVLGGVVGVAVVLRRLAFYGDALTHTIFPGIVIAHLLGQSLFLGALVLGLLSAVLLTLMSARGRVTQDAGLAILLSACFSVGVVLVSRQESFASDLTQFLFGNLLTVSGTDLAQTAVVGVIVLTTLVVARKELLLRAFDPIAASAMGYRVNVLDVVLNACIALVVVAAAKAVGTMLTLALLLVPAAAARLVTERLGATVLVAAALGALGGWVGLLVSYHASISYGVRLSSGASVIVTLVAGFLVALAAGPGWRRLRARRRIGAAAPTAAGTDPTGRVVR